MQTYSRKNVVTKISKSNNCCPEPDKSVDVLSNIEYRPDPRIVKAMFLLKIILLLYPAFGLLVSIFDIDKYEISKSYCNIMESIVPSIHGTSMVSSNVSGTCLVISIAWPLAIYLACQWLYWVLPSQIKESAFKQNALAYTIVSVFGLFFFGGTLAWLFIDPLTLEGYGKSSKIICWSLKNGAFTSALIAGLMVIVLFWGFAVSVFLTIKTVIINVSHCK